MVKDIAGQKFNRLTAINPVGTDKRGTMKWACVCDCGNAHVVAGDSLRRGSIKSCGCLNLELVTQRAAKINLSHGHARNRMPTPEYRAYNAAKNRCNNPRNVLFPYYGGRGIKFLFTSFEQWLTELGVKPDPKRLYSVDRIDNDDHYRPGNVRWATRSEQMRNRRDWRVVADASSRASVA